jgi:hypothetical protein
VRVKDRQGIGRGFEQHTIPLLAFPQGSMRLLQPAHLSPHLLDEPGLLDGNSRLLSAGGQGDDFIGSKQTWPLRHHMQHAYDFMTTRNWDTDE